jgi:hypothetical protein
MPYNVWELPTKVKRMAPDPNHKHDLNQIHYWCFVNIYDLWEAHKAQGSLPFDPNPREHEDSTDLNSTVMKEQRETFFDSETPFHQWNLGVTIFVRDAEEVENQRGKLKLFFDKGDGISNGGTTYRNLMKTIDDTVKKEGNRDSIPRDQHLWISVRTNIPKTWNARMAEAHNKTSKVLETALLNAENKFEDIIKTLKNKSYFNEIIFKQNAPGNIDISLILRIMEAFDVSRFANDSDIHPVHVYSGSGRVISQFKKRVDLGKKEEESFHQMLDILPDCLELYDIIRSSFFDFLPARVKTNLNRHPWIKEKNTNLYFINKVVDYDLLTPAIFPILGSFRNFVGHDNDDQRMYWKTSFKNIVSSWKENAEKLMKKTMSQYEETDAVHEIGRSKYHWSNIHDQMNVYFEKTFE